MRDASSEMSSLHSTGEGSSRVFSCLLINEIFIKDILCVRVNQSKLVLCLYNIII